MTQMLEPQPRRARLAALAHDAAHAPAAAVAPSADVSGVLPAVEDSSPRLPLVREAFAARLLKNLSFLDGLIAVYFTLMLGAVAFGSGPGHEACTKKVAIDFVLFALGIALTRGGVLRHGSFANEMAYRITIFCSVFLSYFQLREILPAVSSRAIDADILAFDLRVFGVEPSLAWDRFVTPHTTEWFAFFYFGYFFILSAHVLPMLFNAHNRFRLAHFTLGIVMVFCTGHLVYMLVPGWGPYRHLADHFQHPLEGGLFWSLVRATVDAGGAQKDIFPSLHTAAPTYFAIYSFIHRRSLPFRFTWPVIAFAATQIIIATMFLRWHYLVDIFAGLTLATTSALVSYRIIRWEEKRRVTRGAEPIFRIVEWPWERPGTREQRSEFEGAAR
jgi:hypothetical protein